MKLKMDNEFYEICQSIISENNTLEEWASIESSDMFQTKHYCGGYDAIENAFCFSYYDDVQNEFWFQLTLNDIRKIIQFEMDTLDIRPADNSITTS